MGYVVLHLKKPKGSNHALSAHTERKVDPNNADFKRTHLNRELIPFPEAVKNRSEAITYRLEHAGLSRKIGKNQVTSFLVMLSGSPEDMIRIEKEGRLEEWCDKNIQWLEDTFGKENVVSALLHRDEKTPHIHATIVPIVKGERRKASLEENNGKRKYKKKNPNRPRLCADDVITREKLEGYQDSYALYMDPFGLQRGIKGSEARHIDTADYYRRITKEIKKLEDQIRLLQKSELEIQTHIESLHTKEKIEKVKDQLFSTVGNLFGSNKQELLKEENRNLSYKIEDLKKEIQTLHNTLLQERKEYKETLSGLINFVDKINKRFPQAKDFLEVEELCKNIGLDESTIIKLLKGNPVPSYSGKLYSDSHRKYFPVESSTLEIIQNPRTDKIHLVVDQIDIGDWFKKKSEEYRQKEPIKKIQKGRRL
ncbi:MAG: plasmid recombination protein [Tannerellaceae bacterium]|nr:plasmid recombination protein [Tannerellaceae bacterium]